MKLLLCFTLIFGSQISLASVNSTSALLYLRSPAGNCSGSIVKFGDDLYLVSANHCRDRVYTHQEFSVYADARVYGHTAASPAQPTRFTRRIKGLSYFPDQNLFIYDFLASKLKKSYASRQAYLNLRKDPVSKGEKLQVMGYPNGYGPIKLVCTSIGHNVLGVERNVRGAYQNTMFNGGSFYTGDMHKISPVLKCEKSKQFKRLKLGLHGMSGGPVTDTSGNFVGILSSSTYLPDDENFIYVTFNNIYISLQDNTGQLPLRDTVTAGLQREEILLHTTYDGGNTSQVELLAILYCRAKNGWISDIFYEHKSPERQQALNQGASPPSACEEI